MRCFQRIFRHGGNHMSTLDDYLFQVGKAASQFQFLEEGLEMYLAECFDIGKTL